MPPPRQASALLLLLLPAPNLALVKLVPEFGGDGMAGAACIVDCGQRACAAWQRRYLGQEASEAAWEGEASATDPAGAAPWCLVQSGVQTEAASCLAQVSRGCAAQERAACRTRLPPPPPTLTPLPPCAPSQSFDRALALAPLEHSCASSACVAGLLGSACARCGGCPAPQLQAAALAGDERCTADPEL